VRIKILPLPCQPVVTIFATDPYASEAVSLISAVAARFLGWWRLNHIDPPIIIWPPKTAMFSHPRLHRE
jgi:hypothetical protein